MRGVATLASFAGYADFLAAVRVPVRLPDAGSLPPADLFGAALVCFALVISEFSGGDLAEAFPRAAPADTFSAAFSVGLPAGDFLAQAFGTVLLAPSFGALSAPVIKNASALPTFIVGASKASTLIPLFN